MLLAGWAAAELRRREAERQRDALRADAIKLLVRLSELASLAEQQMHEFHKAAPPFVSMSLEDYGDHLRSAGSAMNAARQLADEARPLFDRRQDGRDRR